MNKSYCKLLTLALYVNQNVSCHLFALDDTYNKNKAAILAPPDKLLKVATIHGEEIIHSDGPRSEFKNLMKDLDYFNKKYQVPFTRNYFTTGLGICICEVFLQKSRAYLKQMYLVNQS